MRRTLACLLCAAALPFAITALAQNPPPRDGIDPSWNGGVPLTVPVPGYNVAGAHVAVQPDGRILLAGGCSYPYSTNPRTYASTGCMARTLPDGQRDYGLGPGQSGAFALLQLPSWPALSGLGGLTLQSDGRIVVAGDVRTLAPSDATDYASVARLLADGTLDPSVPSQPVRFEFAHNATDPASIIAASARQADGKLVVAGFTHRVGAGTNLDFAVARLRSDLSLDPTFNGTGIRVVAFDLGGDGADYAQALAIQGDGKIVVAGYADMASGSAAAVLRLNADGTPDASFGNGGRVTFASFGGFSDVEIDGAGRIWLAGGYPQAGKGYDFLVARLRANGALDTDFNGAGYQTVAFDLVAGGTDSANKLLLQPDGKLVLAGLAVYTSSNDYEFAAARLLPDGSLDPRFGVGGKLYGLYGTQGERHLSQAADAAFAGNRIVLAGSDCYYDADIEHWTNWQFGVAMIRLDTIFANGFEH